MWFLRSGANRLKIHIKSNDVAAIWGELKFKQSFAVLGEMYHRLKAHSG